MPEEAKEEDSDSMEEILSSIRDIIADAPEEDAANDTQEDKSSEEEDVLELTDVVEESAEPQETDVLDDIDAALEDGFQAAPDKSVPDESVPDESVEEETVDESVPDESVPDESVPDESVPDESVEEEAAIEEAPVVEGAATLLSDDEAEASSASLKELVNSIPKPEIDSKYFRSGTTVEDLVVESLKPMLSEWLNDNLSVIVEELVQKEIRKLVPRE